MRVKKIAGFSLLELLVVITAISLLGGVLLERVLFYQEQAEKAAMEQMAGMLRSALRLQIAERLPKGRQGMAELIGQNPMDWLVGKPANYRGERAGAGMVPGGSWYFDSSTKSLVYMVGNGRHFLPNPAGRKEVRYQVQAFIGGKPQAPRNAADKQGIDGVTLVLLEPYQWF